MTRVVFMGSADFAVPSLYGLVDAGFRIALVVTRADKPRGRGLALASTPVKKAAVELGLELFQPPGLKRPENQARIEAARPDVIVVAAYGRILPPEVLDIPPRLPCGRYACINVHGSLLPKYRGAAPVQWAVIRGESETGVTIMAMDEGMDTGPIIAQSSTPISPRDTAGSVFERLSSMGARLLVETLPGALDGSLEPTPQDDSNATFAPIMKKQHGRISWTMNSMDVANLVRGVEPWPGSFTFTPGGLRLRVFPFLEPVAGEGRPGEVLSADGRGMVVATGDGAVLVPSVQPAGGKRMTPLELINGRRLRVGDVLCDEGT